MTEPITLGVSPKMHSELERKRAELGALLARSGRTLVAYSGGVDSALLLAEAHRVLGDRACGVIARSPSLPKEELAQALDLASSRGIPVRVVRTEEMERPAYRANGPDRCFHCKSELFEKLSDLAREEGWDTLAYGAITDDLGDIRPGMTAAERLHVRAPLLEAGLSKLEVRMFARRIGLPVWDKPQAACLASRIPHGSPVTEDKLEQVERGEALLKDRFGLRVLRLRHEGSKARIETDPAEIPRLSTPENKQAILSALSGLGFTDVELDPRGYRRADPIPGPDLED